MQKKPVWIVITGGVISTLGKGIVSSSLALLLKKRGYSINPVKIDPYINIDAGTMRPTEHGETFVTYDGGETDQDLGNYERFLSQKVSKKNNITTGQIFLSVIQKERNLEYKGKTVEYMSHIPLEIEDRLRALSKKHDFVFIELGGTVGDYENIPFLEAFRRMKLKGEEVVFVHVTYLPVPKTAGEMKSKPTQHSIKALNQYGIHADFVVGRSSHVMDGERKQKIALLCNVAKQNIISCPDVSSIYEVPEFFLKQGFDEAILNKVGMSKNKIDLTDWTKRLQPKSKEVIISIVGKYFKSGNFQLQDSYVSVIEAIKHACFEVGVNPKINWLNADEEIENKLKKSNAIIVPGGFGETSIEGKINAIRIARENKIPYLGLCYGLQLAVIEHARNLLNIKDANTTEITQNCTPVISLLPEQIELMKTNKFGATMRLGEQISELKKDSLVHKLYENTTVSERHRHRYEVNPKYVKKLEQKGLVVSGVSNGLVEFIERNDHPFFVATQAHPEFNSSFLKPSPIFLGLIKAALKTNSK